MRQDRKAGNMMTRYVTGTNTYMDGSELYGPAEFEAEHGMTFKQFCEQMEEATAAEGGANETPKKHRRITLTVQRGEHAPHSRVLHERVRAGKAERVLAQETLDLIEHETRSGMRHEIVETLEGVIATVGGCTFTISMEAVQ